jgi:glycosyltransferase involved in cell wall biosynthesis
MSQPKHILILSSWYPTKEKLFLGNFVEQHARLIAKNHQVTVLNVVAGEQKSMEIVESKSGNFREIQIHFPKGSNKLSKFINERKAFKAGLKLIQNVDLIHAHVLLPKGYLFVRAKKHFQCPLIVTEHASLYRQDVKHEFSRKERAILGRTVKHVDQFIAVSELLKSDLEHKLKIKHCDVIGNPVNTDLFIPKSKTQDLKKRFLHISTLAEIKNVKGIIDAFDLAFETSNELSLTIVSDENYDELKSHASQLPCAQSIEFLGPLHHEETVSYYQHADFFILNSEYETFSIVVAEALSCGVPVISTNVGIATNMPKDLGRNIPKNDPISMAEMMLSIQKSTFDAEKIRNHAMQFSNEAILAKLNALYAKI